MEFLIRINLTKESGKRAVKAEDVAEAVCNLVREGDLNGDIWPGQNKETSYSVDSVELTEVVNKS